MPTHTISVYRYLGSLLAGDLQQENATVLVNLFETETTGELADDQGTLDSTDDNVSSFRGSELTYIGSGTATPGIAGIPLGTPVPVVVFADANGDIFFHYPAGTPNILSFVGLVLDIDPNVPYEVFPNPYSGTAGQDNYVGDYFGNQMYGLADNDTIFGNDGEDYIDGGDGNDEFSPFDS